MNKMDQKYTKDRLVPRRTVRVQILLLQIAMHQLIRQANAILLLLQSELTE